VSVNLVYKIFRAWGEHAKEKISANPYALIDDIWGVGFKKADAVARHLGFAPDSYRRIRAGLIFLLQEASGDGHVYLPGSDIVDCGEKLLEVKREAVQYSLDHMVIENTVVNDNERIYLPLLHKVETSVAQMLRERVSGCNDASALQSANIDEWIARYRSRTKWEPDSRQVEAVKAAVKSRILLITGGPGTGKTTTLQVIVSFFRERQVTIALAAPTGRAAQRMGSIAGIDASTIHRLLEYRPNQSGSFFAKNAGNPIAAGVVIIDESSMIDIRLMHSLLCAVPKNAVLIFVGDSNQLPSVGPGNVLADMISCGALPHARLTHIFRQAARSRIVTAAHEIINGTVPHFINAAGDNCFFMIKETPEECRNTVIELAESRLPKKYGFDPVRDIQVLSPMHRGELGTQAFNRLLQEKLNPSGKRLTRGETSYAVGDKVMQVRNNYDTSVFNGDIGFITSISDESVITVDFGGMRVEYEFSELDELTHAYCISIHKSQGCEFRAVVIPVMTQHYIMLQKNLLYTAVTRARELCIIVGMPRALKAAVSNDSGLNRNSGLAGRITSARL
jgi:exodeoxyribonuclease V alpha subunit